MTRGTPTVGYRCLAVSRCRCTGRGPEPNFRQPIRLQLSGQQPAQGIRRQRCTPARVFGGAARGQNTRRPAKALLLAASTGRPRAGSILIGTRPGNPGHRPPKRKAHPDLAGCAVPDRRAEWPLCEGSRTGWGYGPLALVPPARHCGLTPIPVVRRPWPLRTGSERLKVQARGGSYHAEAAARVQRRDPGKHRHSAPASWPLLTTSSRLGGATQMPPSAAKRRPSLASGGGFACGLVLANRGGPWHCRLVGWPRAGWRGRRLSFAGR